MRSTNKLFTFTLILFSLFSLTFKNAFAQAEYFSDDFNDNNVEDWVVDHNTCNTTWQSGNKTYGIEINQSNCSSITMPIDLPPININQNYRYEVDIFLPATISEDRSVLFRYINNSQWYGLHLIGNYVYFEKVYNGVNQTSGTVNHNYVFSPDQWYHFKIEYIDMVYKVYVENYQLFEIQENPPFLNEYRIGLRASVGQGTSHSNVRFDNVKATLLPSDDFELPIYYEGRGGNDETNFVSKFWNKLTASFDHERKGKYHIPFTGEEYKNNECKKSNNPIKCYNGHNGTDFDDDNNSTPNDPEDYVYSVSFGQVVYTSDHTSDNCTPEKGGYGCVVIAEYPTKSYGDLYALFAHLDKILVEELDQINVATKVAEIGNTGCNHCGEHLHFGVLKPVPNNLLSSNRPLKMSKKDWQGLLYEARPAETPSPQHHCTYNAPNGMKFAFQDPSGWNPDPENNPDPWEEECGVISPYLWKYDVGTVETESSILQPLEEFLHI